jgi:hypothetical protein
MFQIKLKEALAEIYSTAVHECDVESDKDGNRLINEIYYEIDTVKVKVKQGDNVYFEVHIIVDMDMPNDLDNFGRLTTPLHKNNRLSSSDISVQDVTRYEEQIFNTMGTRRLSKELIFKVSLPYDVEAKTIDTLIIEEP